MRPYMMHAVGYSHWYWQKSKYFSERPPLNHYKNSGGFRLCSDT